MDMERDYSPVKLTRGQEIKKFFTFVFFSISAGLVQIGVYTLLNQVLGIESWWLSYVPAFTCSVIWNFTINRRFNFKSVSNIQIAMLKVAVYNAAFLTASTLWG